MKTKAKVIRGAGLSKGHEEHFAGVLGSKESSNIISVIVATLLIASIPILFNHNFYFIDDTQAASTGPWRYLGEKILEGNFSILDPNLWVGGNWIIEGQFGLFSPITWAIGVCSLLFESVWLYATFVKLFFIAVVAIGTYKSARILKASPFFSILVGVAAPFCGFSSYFDQAAWFSGLTLSAVCINYFWISKLAESGKISLAAPLLVALCGVAIGYVYISIVLLLISAAQSLSGILNRTKVAMYLTILFSIILASVALYLPALLTAPVTLRSQQGLTDTGWYAPTIQGLLTNFLPLRSELIPNYGPLQMQAPVMYGSILFALLIFAKGREMWSAVRNNLDVIFIWFFAFALLFGPSEFGPLRWPLRFYPLLIIFSLLLLAATVGRIEQLEIKKRTKLLSTVLVVVFAMSWGQIAQNLNMFFANLVFLLLFVGGWILVLRYSKSKTQLKLTAVGLAFIALATTGQHFVAPKTPLADFNLPQTVQEYRDAAHLAEGRTLYVGNLTIQNPDGSFDWGSKLVGNAWMLAGKQVANSYSVAGFSNFNNLMGENYRGEFSDASLARLFELGIYPFTPLADLMQLDTVVAFRNSAVGIPAAPSNWIRDDSDSRYVIFKRINQTSRTPFWVGGNAVISGVRVHNDSLSFHYSTNNDNPAVFIFPRLAWPGYKTSLGRLLTPTQGFLLTLEVPPGKDKEVTVEYEPPAWDLSKLFFYIICFILLLSEALFRIRKGRKKIPSPLRSRILKSLAKKFPSLLDKKLDAGLQEFAKGIYSISEIRYVIFGVLNTIFGYLSFVVANQIFGTQFSPTVILLIGLAPSIVFAYTTQRIFIWRSKVAVRKELPKFLTVTFVQFGINVVLLEMLVGLNLGIMFSQTVLTISVPVVTFFAHKYWTFRHTKTKSGKIVGVQKSQTTGSK
jgi:putative flippase GtrA